MKYKLHDDSDWESDDSDHGEEPPKKPSSSQKTPIVKATVKSMDSNVLATLEEIRGNVGLLVRAQGLAQAKDPWIQVQEASDLIVLKNDLKRERKEHKETLSRLSDTESRLTNLNQELTAVRKDFEEYKTTNDAKLEEIMAQMALGAKAQRVEEIWQRAQALPEAEEEPEEESEESSSDSDLTLDDYNLSDFELEDEVKEPEVYDAATKAAAFGALLFQAQQALGLTEQPGTASRMLNMDEEIPHPAIDYSQIQNLSESTAKPSGSTLDTSGSSIKSKGLTGSPARPKDLPGLSIGPKDILVGPAAKIETVSAALLIEEEYGSISETEDTIPGPAELPLFANLLTKRQEPSSPAPSTQKPSDPAPQTQDPLSQRIADLEAALQSKTSEISRMEQEHEETVRLMSEQLDNVYERLRPDTESLDSQDLKDVQIENLAEQNKELQSLIQAKSEEVELQRQEIRKLEAKLRWSRAGFTGSEGSEGSVNTDSVVFRSDNVLTDRLKFAAPEEKFTITGTLLNHFRSQIEMLQRQVNALISQKDNLQKLLEESGAPRPKDIQIEELKERNAELQSIIQANCEEAELLTQRIWGLETNIEEMIENRYGAKFLALSQAYVDSKKSGGPVPESETLLNHFKSQSQVLRSQLNILTAQRDNLQKVLETTSEDPGSDPGSNSESETLRRQVNDLKKLLQASEGFMPTSNTQNLRQKCEDLKRDVKKLTEEKDILKSLLETEVDARESLRNENAGLRKRNE